MGKVRWQWCLVLLVLAASACSAAEPTAEGTGAQSSPTATAQRNSAPATPTPATPTPATPTPATPTPATPNPGGDGVQPSLTGPNVALGTRDSGDVTIHSVLGGDPLTVSLDGSEGDGLLAHRQNFLLHTWVGDTLQFHLVDTSTGGSTQVFSTQTYPGFAQSALQSEWLLLDPRQSQDPGWVIVNLSNGDTLAPADQEPFTPPVFSSDGTKLLYTTTDSHSILVDLGDSSTTDLGPLERIIALSPSGEHVVTQGVGLEVVSVAADKVARVDGVQKVFGWLDDDTIVVRTDTGAYGLADAGSGAVTITVTGVGAAATMSSGIRAGRLMVDAEQAIDGVILLIDMLSGEAKVRDVPGNSPVLAAEFNTEKYVWGFIGGANGSQDNLGGWVLDRETGVVTTFEQPLADGALFAHYDNAYSADRSAAILSDNAGSLYLARPGQSLERLPSDGSTRGAFCADGSIVVFRPNSEEPTKLLSAGSYEVIREFGPADWAICVGGAAASNEAPTTSTNPPIETPTTAIESNSSMEATADGTFCAELDQATAGVERMFQVGLVLAELDPADVQQTAATLASLAQRAPGEAGALLAIAADTASAFAAAASVDPPDTNGLRAQREELLPSLDLIDIDAAEAWAERECGIERLGIQLRLTDDDRVTVSPGPADDGETSEPSD